MPNADKKQTVKSILRTSSGTIILAIARMASSLILTKLTVLTAGPAGLALLGAFQNMTGIILALCSGGLNSAIVKQVAAAEDTALRQDTITQLLKITLLATGTTLLLALLMSGWLASTVLGNSVPALIIWAFCALAIGMAMNTALLHVFVGLGGRREFITLNLTATAITLGLSFPIVRNFGMVGALMVAPISNSIIVFASIWLLKRGGWQLHGQAEISLALLKRLASFPLMALSGASFIPLAQLFVRDRLASQHGAAAAGNWQAVSKISEAYMMIVGYLILLLVLPRFSARSGQPLEFRDIKASALGILIPAVLLMIPIYLFRDLVIYSLFSEGFLPIKDLFSTQMLGDLLRTIILVIQAALTARALTASYIAIEAMLGASFVAFGMHLIPIHGANGAVIAWSAACFLTLAASGILWLGKYRQPGA